MTLDIETCNEDELCDFVRFNATAVIGTKCPHCGFVGGEGLSRVDEPCPNCRKTGKNAGLGRFGYPSGNAGHLLLMVSDFYVRSIEQTNAKAEEVLGIIRSRYKPDFSRAELVKANTEVRSLYNCETDVNKRYENMEDYVSSFFKSNDKNEIAELLALILRVERSSYLDAGVVLITITLFELLYREFLRDLCRTRNASLRPLYKSKFIKDKSWFGRCEHVFGVLTETDIKDFLNRGERLNIYLSFLTLRYKRNKFVHGKSTFIMGRRDSISAVRLSLLACLLFQELNNAFCVQNT